MFCRKMFNYPCRLITESVSVRRMFASSVCLFVRSITQQEGWLSPTERASVSAHFGLPWVRPWDNRGKCHMDEKRIQCLSNAYQHIYPSIFNRLRATARYWSEIATFSYTHLHLTPVGGVPVGIPGKKFGPQKTIIMGLPGSEDSLTIG